MELFYSPRVDGTEFETLSIELKDQRTLKELKANLIEENEWVYNAKVFFYRDTKEGTKPFTLATSLEAILNGNSKEMPLYVIVTSPTMQPVLPPVQGELTVNALGRIEKKLDDMGTVDLRMSEATMNFTSSLLKDMKIKYVVRPVNKETGKGEMKKYPWGIQEHDADGQPGCKVILEGEMLPLKVEGASMSMHDVRNCSLPELKAGKRKSNGFSDLAVGPEESMEYAVTCAKDLVLAYTVALVDLKTGRADLKQGQLLLQLVSLAFVSGMGQGVVVLGTDCVNKWWLLHFSGYNSVVVQPYTHGKKCIADFKMLIAEGAARMQQNTSPEKLTTVFEEDGAEVDMADFGVEESDRDKAIDREAKLRKLASVLGSLYGETPEVPSWAKPSETCSSYYT